MALVLLLLVVAGGTLATYLWDDDEMPLPTRVAAGVVVGLAVFGLLGFGLALGLGLTRITVYGAAAAAAAPLALLAQSRRRARVTTDLAAALARLVSRPGRTLALLVVAAIITVTFEGALYVRSDGDRPGIYTFMRHNASDLAFHLGVVQSFVRGDNFPPQHPEFSGARLRYPFIVDLVAAALMRGGLSLRAAFLAENLLLAWALVALLMHWARRLTRDGAAAALVPALVLLSGGLGFWMLARDMLESERGLFSLLGALPHSYTIVGQHGVRWMSSPLLWGNAVTTLFIPQRAFLFGLPLFVLALTLVWEGVRKDVESSAATRARRMTGAGCIAGLLPLIHTHSFVVFVAAALCLTLLFRDWRAWSRLFVPLAVLGGPQLLWLFSGTGLALGGFVRWRFGWQRSDDGFLWFWLHNTGLVIPAVVAALLWRGRTPLVPRDLARFLAPFAGCFIIPNLFKLSPWYWDNIKFLFFAHVAATPLVALLLARLWRIRACATSVLLLVTMTLAGALDVARAVTRADAACVFDASGMEFARMLARRTPPGSVVLRIPMQNHPALLAGRLTPLGDEVRVRSHGFDPGTRASDLAGVYLGWPDARERVRRLGVDFIVLGPQERRQLAVSEAFLGSLPLVAEADGYRIYRVDKD
jgi:hypothetical protein